MAGIPVTSMFPDFQKLSGEGGDVVMSVINQAMPAIAASKPILDQVAFATAVAACVLKSVEVIQATVNRVSDPLAPPPDVAGLLACVPELEAKAAALLNLLPQVWIPILIAQVCQILIRLITTVIAKLQELKVQIQALLASSTMASLIGSPTLQAIVVCRQDAVDKEMQVLAEIFRQVGILLAATNLLIKILKDASIIPASTEFICLPTSNFATDLIDELIAVLNGFLVLIADFLAFITQFFSQLGLSLGAGNGLDAYCPPAPPGG